MPHLENIFAAGVRRLGLPDEAMRTLETVYRPVAEWLDESVCNGPRIIGVTGAQGSGKSTFCALLADLLEQGYQRRVAVLSIDDIYHTRATRADLGENIHPLCAIRGVPGTHDVPLGTRTLHQLMQAGAGDLVAIPRFDKARDDRKPPQEWDQVQGPVDIILFEGWCVGCPLLPTWEAPYNEREAREDPHGVWARWSAQCLEAEYRSLFSLMSALIMIQVPSMESVRRGRWLQEQRLWETVKASGEALRAQAGLMTAEQVTQYVALFARHTEHMLTHLPAMADVLIRRDGDFQLVRWPGHGQE